MKETKAAVGCLGRFLNPMTYTGGNDAGSSADDDDEEDPPGEEHGEHGGGHDDHSHDGGNMSVADLLGYIKGLADLGVKSFYYTASIQAFYNLGLTTAAFNHWYPKMTEIDAVHPGSLQKPKAKLEAKYFFLGC